MSTLGELLRQARMEAGYTFKGLAEMSGVGQGQISKLEQDQVRKPNPAHLAALADPLGLSIYDVYKAAGYKTPEALTALTPALERALAELPDQAVAKVERYIERFAAEGGGAALELDQAVESN